MIGKTVMSQSIKETQARIRDLQHKKDLILNRKSEILEELMVLKDTCKKLEDEYAKTSEDFDKLTNLVNIHLKALAKTTRQ